MSDLRKRAVSILNGATGGQESWSKWDREIFDVVDEAADEIANLRAQLASAEKSIREQAGMEYFGQRFDRVLDRAERAETQLASARKALESSEKSFEAIRLTLIKNLHEPERLAFWEAVQARDAIRAALTDEKRT